MKTPRHWSRPPDRPGWRARALAPLSAVWSVGTDLRARLATPKIAPVPVLCVGNLTAGGAGKSPMVAALAQRLSEAGRTVHVVSRGFGGQARGPHRVDPATDTVAQVGDEPLMLAAWCPVWVARDRAAGARAAAAAGAELVILDDGFQNPHLRKDASIVMVDAVAGFGNARLIPAGPLREPIESGLARADLVVLVGDAASRAAAMETWPELRTANPLGAELVPVRAGLELTGDPVHAFAGIAHPEKFFTMLEGLGARLAARRAFPDHHVYSPAILRRLIADAHAAGAMLVTTEKDAVRLPPALRREVMTVPVRLVPGDWAPIDALIDRIAAKSP